MLNEHEAGFARTFVRKEKAERVQALLASAKRRGEFLKTLAHFDDLDKRYARTVPTATAHTAEEWATLLRAKGAPATCWVISEDRRRDGLEEDLADALKKRTDPA